MDPNEFRRLGHELIDWVADYRERIDELPGDEPRAAGRGRGAAARPSRRRTGGGLGDIVADLDRIVLPGITHWNHPGFFAYFPSNTDLSSVLADLVSSGLGAQGMSWQTSPAATEVEDVVMEWLRQMLGLPDTFTGVIHDTASTATLCALLCARERTIGLQPEPRRPAGRGRAARGLRLATRRTARSPRRRSSPASAPSTCA